ncbi:MAG: hypothetical protein ACJAQ0_001562 [Dasania sp.]|jgi:hypothetical protein
MNCNSLDVANKQFPVSVFFNMITLDQANHIIERSHILYERMETLEQRISDLYGKEQTVRLMDNFNDIISYSDKVFDHGSGETFDEYFLKLESFCGQIENIIKMIRYYYALFESNM